MAKFQHFRTLKGNIFLGIFFPEVRNFTLEEKNSFANTFQKFSKFFNILLCPTSSRKVSAVEFLVRE